MAYDGMMRLLHETPRPNDPRVDAMLDWAERGWSLDVNPGNGTAMENDAVLVTAHAMLSLFGFHRYPRER